MRLRPRLDHETWNVVTGDMIRRTNWIIAFLIGCTSCTTAQTSQADNAKTPTKQLSSAASTAVLMERGEKAFKEQKWADAVASFDAATKADPKNRRAWARLGASLHAANDFNRAAAAWQKAIDIEKSPSLMYNLACAHARAGRTEDALRWLAEAVNGGFQGAEAIRKDPDLATIAMDARFIVLVDKLERTEAPCRFGAEFKQFDFWIGEWDVFTTSEQKAGENIVSSASDGCLIVENWTGSRGGTGKSINFYDPARKQWRQIWVGSGGAISEFAGEFKEGAMRFVSEPRRGTEAAPVRRLTFFHLGPNEVRQFAEQSTDGGKTFTTEYDFTYKRRTKK